MAKGHALIFVPGLDGMHPLIEQIVGSWRQLSFSLFILPIDWKNSRYTADTWLAELHALVYALHSCGHTVSLIGYSAGGSLVVNALASDENNYIHKAITICSRLRKGDHRVRSLEHAAVNSRSFHRMVQMCEKNQKLLTHTQLQKLMTMRCLVDEIVPSDTSLIEASTTTIQPSVEHVLSIFIALTLGKQPLVDFLSS